MRADSNRFESQVSYHFGHFDVSIGYREEFGGACEESAYLIALTTRRQGAGTSSVAGAV